MGLRLVEQSIEITGIDATHLVQFPHQVPEVILGQLEAQSRATLLQHQDVVYRSLEQRAASVGFYHWWERSKRRGALQRQQEARQRYQSFVNDPIGTIERSDEEILDHLSNIIHDWDDPAVTLELESHAAPQLVAHFQHQAQTSAENALKEERSLLLKVPDADIDGLLSMDLSVPLFPEGTKMRTREYVIEQFGYSMNMEHRFAQRNLGFVATLQSVELQLGHA
jgi:hypothetical protein